MQGKNLQDLKAKIQTDIILVNKLLEATSFEAKVTSHFSSGNKIAVKKSVSEFNIDYNIPEIRERFNDYCKEIYFAQKFQKNYSENKLIPTNEQFAFDSNFDLSENDSIFEKLKSSIDYTEKKVFHNGKAIELNQIGLKKIDSILTDIKLEIPISFDKFSISKSHNKKIEYNGLVVKVNKINENIVELNIPTKLYNNIIGYQAFNKNNMRMDVSAFSANSLLEINQTTKDNLNSLRNIFQKILNENDEDKAKLYLKEITQSMFDTKNEMYEFDDYVKKLGKSKEREDELGFLGIYEEIAEKGEKVLWIQHESVMVEFPDDVESIEIYVKSNSITLQSEQVTFYEKNKFYDYLNPYIVFNTYEREKGYRYGISDRYGNKIIDAIYKEIRQKGNEYFFVNEKLHWLDVANKEMISLPEFNDYHGTIKKGYDIFDKKVNGKVGLVKDRNEIILPFEYFSIINYKKFIVGNGGYDEKIDFFDMNFNKIQKNEIKEFYKINEFIATDIDFPLLFVVKNKDGKNALMDINLKYLTPFKYDFINPFYRTSNYYVVGVQKDDSGYLETLIDEKGNEVAPLIFSEISLSNGIVTFEINKKTQTMNFDQFAKTYRNK